MSRYAIASQQSWKTGCRIVTEKTTPMKILRYQEVIHLICPTETEIK